MARNRNRHQPGRETNSHEGRQHAQIGKRAKAGAVKSGPGLWPAIRSLESKQSISASKLRERSRSRKR